MNARQKRLFDDARKRNPNLKMPAATSPPPVLTEEDLALIKQGVGDKSPREQAMAESGGGEGAGSAGHSGMVVTYFEEKGFGFIRPDDGGKDIFFHVSRLAEGDSTQLTANTPVAYQLGMDRNGKIAATEIRIVKPE